MPNINSKKKFVPTKVVPFNFNRPIRIKYKKFTIKLPDRLQRNEFKRETESINNKRKRITSQFKFFNEEPKKIKKKFEPTKVIPFNFNQRVHIDFKNMSKFEKENIKTKKKLIQIKNSTNCPKCKT